jgi:2-C-methyl-D-erythritol 4-phosphate cytidylyltransferase
MASNHTSAPNPGTSREAKMADAADTRPRIWGLILAAGSGTRAKTDIPKQFLPLNWEGQQRRIVLDLLLTTYQEHPAIAGITLVYPPSYSDLVIEIARDYPKIKKLVPGGATRHQSVRLGLASVPAEITCIHDAARPVVHRPALDGCISKLRSGSRGVMTVFHPYASMILCKNDGPVTGILERAEIAYGQCPVAYFTHDLVSAFDAAEKMNLEFRDEPALMRHLRPDITLETVEGHQSGFKLTYPGDLDILKIYLANI